MPAPDRRTITVTLTAAQFSALSSAVAFTDVDLDDRDAHEDRITLDAAWAELREAWHRGTEHPKPPASDGIPLKSETKLSR